MGSAKEWLLRQWERGYREAEGAICADCVTDATLIDWIENNLSSSMCRFCGTNAELPIAASFDEFVGIVLNGVRFDWSNPDDEGISYISAEGGYQAPIESTLNILHDYDISDSSEVLEAISDVVAGHGWVEREYYIGDKSQRLMWGWEAFKEVVKHQTRYVFLAPEETNGSAEVPPSAMLAEIGAMVVDELADLDLITEITMETDLFRIRIGPQAYKTGAEIGTPPAHCANQSNRMSPAGIPMFYGAFDVRTAQAETFDSKHHSGQILSIGTFRAARNLRVLNLADLPVTPSVFEEEGHHRIHSLRFLHAFAHDIVQPIARDGREHIEYVPTQIVTEYFRRVFRDRDRKAIDGIIYRSSRVGADRAFVLFCENEQCFALSEGQPRVEQLVELTAVTHKQV